jgi:hypothetical protein
LDAGANAVVREASAEGSLRIAEVNMLPDVRGVRPADGSAADSATAPEAAATEAPAIPASTPARPDRSRVGSLASARSWIAIQWALVRWPLGVYFATRLLIYTEAGVETLFRNWTFWGEVSNWDGGWYLAVADKGYATHFLHYQTPHDQITLGFFPLYPLLIWLTAHFGSLHPGWPLYRIAGLVIALFTGAIATVLVGRLAAGWWGEKAGRRAVLFFCVFPGSVVFSMVYTEGLMLSLVAGCLLAMQQRRWLLAGVLAAFSTAVGPVAVAIIPACAAAAGLELWRRGWRDRTAWRALIAPAMAPLGLLVFGAYLWIHTGTPFASYEVQHYGWQENSSVLALLWTAEHLVRQMFPAAGGYDVVNTNYIAGLIGAVILLGGLFLLVRRPRPPLPSIVWALGVAALTFTSTQTPPNARMLLCAFPAIIVFAQRLRGRWFIALIAFNTLLLLSLSWFTFVGVDFRP